MSKRHDLSGAIKSQGMKAFTEGGTGVPSRLKTSLLVPRASQQRNGIDVQVTTDIDESVRAYGVFQPIVVREHPTEKGMFEIISGERRWRSAISNDIADVPVSVRKCSDEEFEIIQWTENMQRKDLCLKDKILAIGRIRSVFKLDKAADIAATLGEDRGVVTSYLALLDGPKNILDLSFKETDVRKLYELILLWREDNVVGDFYVNKMTETDEAVSRNDIIKARKSLKEASVQAEVQNKEEVVKEVSIDKVRDGGGAEAGESLESESESIKGVGEETFSRKEDVARTGVIARKTAVGDDGDLRKKLVELNVLIDGVEGVVVLPTDLIDEGNVTVRVGKKLLSAKLRDIVVVSCLFSE